MRVEGLPRGRKRRQEVAELLQTLVDQHPTGTSYVTWDNADTHADDDVEGVGRGAAGRLVRLVLLYLPTYRSCGCNGIIVALPMICLLTTHLHRNVARRLAGHCSIGAGHA